MLSLVRSLVLGTALATSVHAQSTTTIDIVGLRGQHRTVSSADLAAMPHHEVTAKAHQVSGTFAGVALADVLQLVAVPRGDSLRGAALSTYVLIEAADGYRVLFALAELDAGFSDKLVLLADRKDGTALSAKDGPFQLVVPDEKRPARWVRQVRSIRVVQAPIATR